MIDSNDRTQDTTQSDERPFVQRALEARDRARAGPHDHIRVCQDVYWIGTVDTNIWDFHGIETAHTELYGGST